LADVVRLIACDRPWFVRTGPIWKNLYCNQQQIYFTRLGRISQAREIQNQRDKSFV